MVETRTLQLCNLLLHFCHQVCVVGSVVPGVALSAMFCRLSSWGFGVSLALMLMGEEFQKLLTTQGRTPGTEQPASSSLQGSCLSLQPIWLLDSLHSLVSPVMVSSSVCFLAKFHSIRLDKTPSCCMCMSVSHVLTPCTHLHCWLS